MSTTIEKRVSISPTRQMTMPIYFYKKFGFGERAILVDEGDKLVIKPEGNCSGEFDDEILADLIKQGYKDQKLLTEFKRIRKQIPTIIKGLIKKSDDAANGVGDYSTYDEVFN